MEKMKIGRTEVYKFEEKNIFHNSTYNGKIGNTIIDGKLVLQYW